MFFKTQSHREVRQEDQPHAPVYNQEHSQKTGKNIEVNRSALPCFEADYDAIKVAIKELGRLSNEKPNELNNLLSIYQASQIITQHYQKEKALSSFLEICKDIIHIDQGDFFLKTANDWKSIKTSETNDFYQLLKEMQKRELLVSIQAEKKIAIFPLQTFSALEQLKIKDGHLLTLPLSIDHRLSGILMLHSYQNQETISENTLKIIAILSQQLLKTIQYSLLHQELEETKKAFKCSQENLLQSVKLATIGEIAGGIAHAVNNPLQVIFGKTQLASLGKYTEEVFDIIETQAMRIAETIRGLLKLASSAIQQKDEYINLNILISNTVKLTQSQIERRGIQTQLNIKKDLPPVIGNSTYLQLILLNFIMSARRRLSGGDILTISAELNTPNSIKITIEDSGSKFPNTLITNILQPFSSNELTEGHHTEFGLIASSYMLQELGGKIQINKESKISNSFILILPLNMKENAI